MKLRHDLDYAAAPAAVLAMLTEPAFWDLVSVANEAISSTVTVEDDGGATRVVVDTEQAITGVPGFAKKFVGESTRAITTQVWSGHEAAFTVDAPGKPTSIRGRATITPKGEGCVLTYDLDVKASVPLIGGKLEKLVVELTTAGLEKERAVGVAWLAGER